MKLTLITAASLALTTSVNAANHCTPGLNYCSSTLRYVDYEFYDPKLRAAGSNNILENWLFHCSGGGQISLVDTCHLGCLNGGVGQSDYCSTCISSPLGGNCNQKAKEGKEE